MKDHLPIAVKRNGNAAWGTTSPSRLRLDLWKMRHHVSAGGEAVLRTTSQASLRDASSPGRKDSLRPEGDVANSDRGRMTTGESVVVVLNEQSFLQSGTAGLRC